MAEAESFALPRVTEMDSAADLPNLLGHQGTAMLFEVALEFGRRIEVVLDGVLAAAGDDNDVIDSGCDAFLHGILNQRFINDGKDFFGLCFGGGRKSRAEPRGWQNGLSASLQLTHASPVGKCEPRTIRFGARLCQSARS